MLPISIREELVSKYLFYDLFFKYRRFFDKETL